MQCIPRLPSPEKPWEGRNMCILLEAVNMFDTKPGVLSQASVSGFTLITCRITLWPQWLFRFNESVGVKEWGCDWVRVWLSKNDYVIGWGCGCQRMRMWLGEGVVVKKGLCDWVRVWVSKNEDVIGWGCGCQRMIMWLGEGVGVKEWGCDWVRVWLSKKDYVIGWGCGCQRMRMWLGEGVGVKEWLCDWVRVWVSKNEDVIGLTSIQKYSFLGFLTYFKLLPRLSNIDTSV